jgi:hypothetical protein
MKKMIFILSFFIYINHFGYSQDIPDYIFYKDAQIYIEQMDSKFIIINNRMILKEVIPPGDKEEVEEYAIEWENNDKFSYIKFNYNGKLFGRRINQGQKRYLILYNKSNVALYDERNNLVYSSYSIKYTYNSDFSLLASSELREGGITYSINNIINDESLLPWVEGAASNGVGENIIYKPNYNIISLGVYFIFSNGFVDYNKNHLYNYNNRVKKIRIFNVGYDEYYDLDIIDTPNIQDKYIQFRNKINQIKIEILEVYTGERYNDLCINLLLPFVF